jgi:hypothetical protein
VKIAKVIVINLLLLIGLDRAVGVFLPAYPEFLNKAVYSWDSYATNYRGYFKDSRVGPDGRAYYTIDRSHELDRRHEHTTFQEPSLKIVAIGDSFTYGQGVRLEDTYIKQLERVRQTPPIYGINLGMGAAGVADVLGQIKQIPASLHPGLIVYGYVLNDPVEAPANARIPYPSGWDFMNVRTPNIRQARPHWATVLARYSRIGDYLLALWERKELSQRTVQFYRQLHDPRANPDGFQQTFDMISQMKTEANALGARFLVAVFPIFYRMGDNYPLEPVHQVILAELHRRGIEALDLLPAYAGHRAEELWVHPVDQHPNDLAQRLAAERIAGWMKTAGLLEQTTKAGVVGIDTASSVRPL